MRLIRVCVLALSAVVAGLATNFLADAQILDENMGCQLVALLPFSDLREGPPEEIRDEGVEYYGYGNWPNRETLEKASFSLMATAEMAINHFNNRDATLVPELSALEGTCNITFPPILYRDSAYSRSRAVESLLNITRQAAVSGRDPTKSICAVIGPTHPRANEGVSAVTESLWIPQFAYSTIDRRLSRRDDFPTLARTITSSQDYGFAIANWVQRDFLKRDFLAIIYDVTDYGEQFEDPLEDAEDFLGYSTITEHIIESDRDTIVDSLTTTMEDGYHSILLATDRLAVLDDVAEVAEELGMLGEDYFWMISGDMITPAMLPFVSYPVDSPTDKLLRGAAVFTNYDPFVYLGEDDFLGAWRQQKDTLAATINEINPLNKTILSDTQGYFETHNPTEYASFLYDSIMLTGISACNAQSKSLKGVGASHVDEVFETEFQGASGYVQFSLSENSSELVKGRLNGRDISGMIYGMYNVRPGKVADNMQFYEFVLTHLYSNETQDPSEMPIPGSWTPVNGTEFLFFDGTPTPPSPLKTTINFNYLSQSIHILGLCFMAVALLVSIGSAAWVFLLREYRLVKASQPEFLYLLCLGSTMVGLSLFFISWDEDKGVSPEQLSTYCSVFPWLFVIGYQVMYLALFFKLWRLSKLLSLRRQIVQVHHALIPFAGVVSCSMVLLAIWQIIDPVVWDREIINGEGEDPWVSYGECNSKNEGVQPFIIPLGIIIGISILVTGAIAFKLKDVQEELAESKWIFFAIFSHVQIWAIGIPTFIILDKVSRDASYLISACLTFSFSTSMVILVIWPKIYVWARNEFFGGRPRTSSVSISVSSKNQCVVSGMDATSTVSASGMGGPERAQAEANARRANALEAEMQQMANKHEQEILELKLLIDDLRAGQNGTLLDADVQNAVSDGLRGSANSMPAPDKSDDDFQVEPGQLDEESSFG